MDKDASYVEFTAPPGFSLPEGTQPEQDFTILTTMRMKGDGTTLCIKEVNGIPVQSTEPAEEKSTGQRMVEAYKESRPS
jgi:hypothetical protein